jgi:hypothetical protein
LAKKLCCTIQWDFDRPDRIPAECGVTKEQQSDDITPLAII